MVSGWVVRRRARCHALSFQAEVALPHIAWPGDVSEEHARSLPVPPVQKVDACRSITNR